MAETVDRCVSVEVYTSSAGDSSPPASPSGMGKRRPTVRNLGSLSLSLTAAWSGVPREDGEQPSPASSGSSSSSSSGHASSPCTPPRTPHFLDECRLCTRPLGRFFDIYMYKGDTPFCSEECRDEHIQFEEVKERSRARFAAAAAMEDEHEQEQAMRVRMVVRAEAAVAVEVV